MPGYEGISVRGTRVLYEGISVWGTKVYVPGYEGISTGVRGY